MKKDFSSLDNKRLLSEIKILIRDEKNIILQQAYLLKEIMRRKLHWHLGYSSLARFCEEELGMTANQAWKRTQLANTITFFPQFEKMIEAGDIHPSHVAKLSNKLTQANEDLIAKNIKGKTSREIDLFVSRVTPCGELLEKSEEVKEVKLNFPEEVYNKLERARKILGQNKKDMSLVEVIDQALEALLDKKDPVRKSERAEERIVKQKTIKEEEQSTFVENKSYPSLGKVGNSRYIPASVKHQIYRKEQRCAYISSSGKKCDEIHGLQVDHIRMWCNGGKHEVENLRLLCAGHNKLLAINELGEGIMRRYIGC